MTPVVWRSVPLGGGNPQPRIITVPGQTMAALGAGNFDGERALVRVTGQPFFRLPLEWVVADGRWYSAGRAILRTDDAWALDWAKQVLPNLRSSWRRPAGGVGWYREGWTAVLTSDTAAGATSVDVTSNTGTAGSIPATGKALVRERVITWTGITGSGVARTLTGVTWNDASAFTFKGGYTPVIPWAIGTTGGGDPGGWGTTAEMVENVGAMVAAGLVVQEKLTGVMNACFTPKLAGVAQPGLPFTITPYYVHADDTDDLGAAANVPSVFPPPTAYMVGPGILLTSTTEHLAGGDGQGLRDNERGFKERIADWQDTRLAFTKKRIRPVLYGTMATVNSSTGALTTNANAHDNGEAYQVTLSFRYRSAVM